MQRGIIQEQLIGNDSDTFVRPQRTRGSSRFDHSQAHSSNRLIVPAHNHRVPAATPSVAAAALLSVPATVPACTGMGRASGDIRIRSSRSWDQVQRFTSNAINRDACE